MNARYKIQNLKYISILLVLIIFQGCTPDRPSVEVDLTIRRFEQDLFSLDTDNLKEEASALIDKELAKDAE